MIRLMNITPTDHEKSEWSRLAVAAYAHELNDTGHKFSGFASLRHGERIPLPVFDALQTEYRQWLIHGFEPSYAAQCVAQAKAGL